MPNPAISTLGQLVIAQNSAFTTNPIRIDFVDFDVGVTLELKDMNATRGKLDSDDARVRQNRNTNISRLRCQPTPIELAYILQWALGGTPTGSGTLTYPLANVPPAYYIWYLPNQGTQWQLQNSAVDVMTIRGSSGEPLEVELEIVSQTYSNPSSGFPSLSLDISTQPFLFSDSASGITVAGTSSMQLRDFSMTFQNGIDRGRFLNSLTLTALQKIIRKLIWSIDQPAGNYDSDWNAALAAGTGITAVFTQPSPATAVLSLTSPAVRLVPRSPTIPFQAETFLRLEGQAYNDASNDPIVTVTLHT
jgi:hypothetical protein